MIYPMQAHLPHQVMTIEWFEARVERIPFSGCWIWMGVLHEKGYGRWAKRFAHRMAHSLYIGAIPAGLCVCHRCDVRCCVNPDHLFLGTNADNNRDALLKGRSYLKGRAGSANHSARLSIEQVELIRSSVKPCKEIAREFCISRSHIYGIRAGRRWAQGKVAAKQELQGTVK